MNNFENWLTQRLLEGGKNTKKVEKPGEARIRSQMKDTRTHYQNVLDNPRSSKEERAEANQFFERGSGWKDRTARNKYK